MKDIDPQLKYCPKCTDEYRTEITICAACDVELLTGEQLIGILEARQRKIATRTAELRPEDDIVYIRRGQLAEMQHFTHMLERLNIGSLLEGDMSTCAKDRFGNTRSHPTTYNLGVKREDAAEALHIIETEHRKSTHLEHHADTNGDGIYNPEAAEVKCPACGHSFPTSETSCPDCGLNFG
jgi:predicted amidophosphoribosyltransferase